MVEWARITRAVVKRARLRPCERDEIVYGLHRNRRMHDEHVGRARDERDRREVSDRIVGQIGLKERQNPEVLPVYRQRVTIRRSLGDDLDSDEADTVIYDQRLTESTRDPLRDESRSRRSGRPARRLSRCGSVWRDDLRVRRCDQGAEYRRTAASQQRLGCAQTPPARARSRFRRG